MSSLRARLDDGGDAPRPAGVVGEPDADDALAPNPHLGASSVGARSRRISTVL